MKVLVNLITRDRLICRHVAIEVTEFAVRNGDLPKEIWRPMYEGKYWCAELRIEPDETQDPNTKRHYELVERGDEIWYAEVGDV